VQTILANGISFLVKDVTIPAGSSLELLSGGKVVLEATDALRVDCSVADKVSGTLINNGNYIGVIYEHI
jgi:hypothetical protein